MKAHPFKIPKPIYESLSVQIDQGNIFYNKLHQHEEIQISYIKAGKGKLLVADSVHRFKEGSIFIIGGHIPHLFQSREGSINSTMVSLFFNKGIFKDMFLNIPETEQLETFIEKTAIGIELHSKRKAVAQMAERMLVKDGLEKFILFLKLVKKINEAEISHLSEFKYPKKLSNEDGRRMQDVFDFVMSNFQKDITLDEVSKKAHMTTNSFCRFFKQRTNKTFFQFLIGLRIEHACQLLTTNKERPIAEVSLLSGFNSVSHFNRTFKKLKGITPSGFANKS